ncbi:MAG: hypothetical protein M3R36_19545 [Bacteroidota bacterium]|nr:hypothetical protein [Bacteroidota bacterium]
MNDWTQFFTATAGAAAPLTGLIFVGVSINLSKILSTRTLPTRALLSIILLLANLIFSIIFLIPDQSIYVRGIEILITGFLVWFIVVYLDLAIYRKSIDKFKKRYILNTMFNQLCATPVVVAAVLMLLIGGAGIYWIALGILFSFIKAVIDGWILLVEIDR